jgi:hypothetical protein
LSGGVSKWEVVVKVVDNFNCWFVKVVKKSEWWCVKMGSGGQNGR